MASTTINPIIKLQNVTKQFSNGFLAVNQLSLEIQSGEFITLLGASGCGKTTTLRMIAGLETISSGAIYINGKEATHVPPYDRQVSLVFQDYALFPHLTVEENVAFGLKMRYVPRLKRLRQAREMLDFIQLPHIAKRKPHQLSGGQRQRVALARSLVLQPSVLLLDEPLGALDAELRRQMQLEMKRIQSQIGITFVYVTHDQEEALTMSDRIVVMRNGQVEQIGTPQDIYEQPKTAFVAQFMGQCNLRQGIVVSCNETTVSIRDAAFGVVQARKRDRRAVVAAGQSAVVMVRPERLRVSLQKPLHANTARGILKAQVYAGSITRLIVQIGNEELLAEVSTRTPLTSGSQVYVSWDSEDAIALTETSSLTPALSHV